MARGGKREGAGRKPKVVTEAKRAAWASILSPAQERKLFKELLKSTNEKIKLEAAKFIIEQRDGRAPQKITHEGDADNPVKVILIGGKL
jgi:hypothetical protein